MSNIKSKLNNIEIVASSLTDKKQQTDYKIKYVSAYVNQWAIINSERDEVSDITFIDCMCNAGVYKDGDLCTAMEVLLIFNTLAVAHPTKTYNLYLNDFDKNKIATLGKVIELLGVNKPNIKIHISNMDVNDYLVQLKNNRLVFGYSKAVILYVDPYDFGTVHIPKIHDILQTHYCELIFNFFISDYVRNWKQNKERLVKCLGGTDVSSKEELIEYMENQLKTGRIKHSFSYQFKTQTNVELYQIMFFTPSKKGLEVLKDTLWKVFGGKFYHKNKREVDGLQLSFWGEEDEKAWLLNLHADTAKQLLLSHNGETMSFAEIEILLIEKSMLAESQIIANVLKPLIEEGKVTKMNLTATKRNYKGDSYKIGDAK